MATVTETVVRRLKRRPVGTGIEFKPMTKEEQQSAIEDAKRAIALIKAEQEYSRDEKIIESIQKLRESDSLICLPLIELMNIPPFSTTIDIEKAELFLCLLTHRFVTANPDEPLPNHKQLFEMQSELIDINAAKAHHCFSGMELGEDNKTSVNIVCKSISYQKDQVYYSVILEQNMKATGVVSICLETGLDHVCNYMCEGIGDEEGRTCPITGLFKRERLRVNTGFSGESKAEGSGGGGEGTSSTTSNYNNMLLGSGPGNSKGSGGGGRGFFISNVPSSWMKSVSSLMLDPEDISNKPRVFTGYNHGIENESNDHVLMMGRVSEDVIAQRNDQKSFVRAMRHVRRMRLNINRPAMNQEDVDDMTEDNEAIHLQYKLREARNNTKRALDNLYVAPKVSKAKLISYEELEQTDLNRSTLREQALKIFKTLFSFNTENFVEKQMKPEEINNIAAKFMGNYIRSCQKHNIVPNFIYGYVIHRYTTMRLSRARAPQNPQVQYFVLAELVIYYWIQMRIYFFPAQMASREQWLKEFRKFTLGVLHLMRTGLEVEYEEKSILVFAKDNFVNEYLKNNVNIHTSKEISTNWIFESQTLISKIVLIHYKNRKEVLDIEYNKALASARSNTNKFMSLNKPLTIDKPFHCKE